MRRVCRLRRGSSRGTCTRATPSLFFRPGRRPSAGGSWTRTRRRGWTLTKRSSLRTRRTRGKRLWVVTTHDHAKQLSTPLRRIRDEDLDHGTGLELYELGTSRTAYDLRKHVGDAVVERQQQDGTFFKCAWNGKKHVCDRDWWHDVWDELHEVGNDRHPGLFLQPTAKKLISRVTWPHVPGARVLAGRVGNRLWAVRNDEGAPTKIRAVVGEREVWSIVLPIGDFAWHPFEVRLQPADAGQPVRFEWTTDDPAWRQTALDARLLDAVDGAVPAEPVAAVPEPVAATPVQASATVAAPAKATPTKAAPVKAMKSGKTAAGHGKSGK